MHVTRPAFASDPFRFGRGPVRVLGESPVSQTRLTDDIKLFAATFVAGFLFVSILIG